MVLKKKEAYYSPVQLLESDFDNQYLKSYMGAVHFKCFYYLNDANQKLLLPEKLTGEDYIVAYNYLEDWKVTKETKKKSWQHLLQSNNISKITEGQGSYTLLNYETWFTPKLPYSYGPKGLSGLPGLILELTDCKYFIHKVEKKVFDKATIEIKKPKGLAVIDLEHGEIFFKMYQKVMKYHGRGK